MVINCSRYEPKTFTHMAAMDFDNLDHISPIFFTTLLKTCWGVKISVFLNFLPKNAPIRIWTHNFLPKNAHIGIWTHNFLPKNAHIRIWTYYFCQNMLTPQKIDSAKMRLFWYDFPTLCIDHASIESQPNVLLLNRNQNMVDFTLLV